MRAFRVSVRHTVSRESRVIRFLVMSVHGRCLLSVWCVVSTTCVRLNGEAEDGLSFSAPRYELAVPCDGGVAWGVGEPAKHTG